MLHEKFLSRLGRWFFALGFIGSGVQQLITGRYVRLIPQTSPGASAPIMGPYVVGVVLIVLCGMMLAAWRGRAAALILAVLLLVTFVALHIPQIATAPLRGYVWTNPCKVLALIGGALVVAVSLQETDGKSAEVSRHRARLARWIARVLLGGFLVLCGVQHYVYAPFVFGLVPSWAGDAKFWTYFTGTALLAGGAGLFLRPTARWAALLSGVMIGLWVVMLHVPRAIAGPDQAGEASGIFEALALSGVALAVAGSLWNCSVERR